MWPVARGYVAAGPRICGRWQREVSPPSLGFSSSFELEICCCIGRHMSSHILSHLLQHLFKDFLGHLLEDLLEYLLLHGPKYFGLAFVWVVIGLAFPLFTFTSFEISSPTDSPYFQLTHHTDDFSSSNFRERDGSAILGADSSPSRYQREGCSSRPSSR